MLLKEENQKLQEMSVAMKELSKNVITLTREEEMLSMKMRVHDNLGYSVLAAQRMLMRESEADRDIFRSQWKQTLDLLNKDNESVEGEQLHRQVQERAKTLGVKIIYTGGTSLGISYFQTDGYNTFGGAFQLCPPCRGKRTVCKIRQ